MSAHDAVDAFAYALAVRAALPVLHEDAEAMLAAMMCHHIDLSLLDITDQGKAERIAYGMDLFLHDSVFPQREKILSRPDCMTAYPFAMSGYWLVDPEVE